MLGYVRNRHLDVSRLQHMEHQPWMLSLSEFSIMLAMSGSLFEFMETSLPDSSDSSNFLWQEYWNKQFHNMFSSKALIP